MKKRVIFSAAMLLAATGAFAQGNGVGGIVEATNMVTSYFDPATKLIYAIGAVVGLIGGVWYDCAHRTRITARMYEIAEN